MNLAEEHFKKWLDEKRYCYLFINQEPETFPEFFRGLSKRPDFLIVINGLGLIAVDVKERLPHPNGGDFILDEEDEIEKYLEFERITRLPVWFVFGNPQDRFDVWRWIPLSKVFQCRLQESSKTGESFRAIPPSECIAIQRKRDGISRIIE